MSQTNNQSVSTFILAACGVMSLWVASWGLLNYFFEDQDVRGQFGDQFGAINALFTGLAFAGLIYTIRLQRQDIALTHKQMEVQQLELQQQNETLKIQRFENSFFNLLNLYSEMISTLYLVNYEDGERIEKKGKDVFPYFWDCFATQFRAVRMYPDSTMKQEVWENAYRSLSVSSSLPNYMRVLFRIIKFVNEYEISDKEKIAYLKIVRSFLSDEELLVIFYNCIASGHGKKFKEFISKYAFFDNLPWRKVFYKRHLTEYDLSSYGALAEDKSFLTEYLLPRG